MGDGKPISQRNGRERRMSKMAKTILMVDDSTMVRQMVSFTLKEAGFDVLEAEQGQQALSLLVLTPLI